MQADQQLTAHFSLSEFTVSQEAVRRGLRNDPRSAELANLQRLAGVLEDVRTALGGHPIVISSGYRSIPVNNIVGGAADSAHLHGRAVDFICPRFGAPREICQRIVDVGIVYDQLIDERGWVHLGIAERDVVPRRQVLTAIFRPGQRTQYLKGLI